MKDAINILYDQLFEAKELIGQGELGIAIDKIKHGLSGYKYQNNINGWRGINREILTLKGRFSTAEDSKDSNTVSQADYRLEISKIREAAMNLIGKTENLLNKESSSSPASAPPSKTVLRIFDPAYEEIKLCFIDSSNCLWVVNDHQIKRFMLNSKMPISRWILLQKRWKAHFYFNDQSYLLASDWEGGLIVFNEKTEGNGRNIRPYRYSNLPVSLVQPLGSEILLAGSWDGKIAFLPIDRENGPKKPVIHFTTPSLPVKIVPFQKDKYIVVDQFHFATLYDKTGEIFKVWDLSGPVLDVWHFGETLFFLSNDYIRKVSVKNSKTDVFTFKNIVSDFSHQSQNRLTVIAFENGQIDWFSWEAFTTIKDESLISPHRIKQIISIFDYNQNNTLMAIGLTEKGTVVSMIGQKLETISEGIIEKIFVSNSHRLMLELQGGKFYLKNIPFISPPNYNIDARIKTGVLKKNTFCVLTIEVVNISDEVIAGITANVLKDEIVSSVRMVAGLPYELYNLKPGQKGEFAFNIKAKATGTIPVQFQVTILDEAGNSAQTIEMNLHSEST